METEGVTRTIHKELKPLLSNLKDENWPMSDIFRRHCSNKSKLRLQCHSDGNQEVYSGGLSGLFEAVFHAYYSHLHLVLSPDDIWLAIMQGVSFHVSNNAEMLRDRLVDFQGQKQLTVTVNPWNDEPEDWARGFKLFRAKILKNIRPEISKVVNTSFSTSTDVSMAANNIALMDCFHKFFKYRRCGGCGVHKVTLEGSVDDWIVLREKSQKLIEYVGMNFWSPYLLPILDEFVNFFTKEVNLKFWDCIYKPMPYQSSQLLWDEENQSHFAGWIINLFPYTTQGDYDDPRTRDKPSGPQRPSYAMKTLAELYAIHDKYLGKLNKETPEKKLIEFMRELNAGVEAENLPKGISRVEFNFVNLLKSFEFEAEAYSGFFGYTLDLESLKIKPAIGWYVAKVIGSENSNPHF